MKRMDKKVALVTGGQQGLGAAILREFAEAGANCIINYPFASEAKAANDLASELTKLGTQTIAVEADVSDVAQVESMFSTIISKFGRVDVVVNNAGVNPLKSWEDLDLETWETTLKVNITGVFNCCRAALVPMKKQGKGSIVNIASVAAFIGRSNADYIASKSALLGLTRSLARQYGQFGIRANCVSPGFHNTEMTKRARQTNSGSADEFIKQVPLGYLAEADSIGKATLFLASDDAYYITGHNLVVDGGLTLR